MLAKGLPRLNKTPKSNQIKSNVGCCNIINAHRCTAGWSVTLTLKTSLQPDHRSRMWREPVSE